MAAANRGHRVSVDMSGRCEGRAAPAGRDSLAEVVEPERRESFTGAGAEPTCTANQATVPRGTSLPPPCPNSIHPNLNQFGGNESAGIPQATRGLGSVTSATLCQAVGECDRIVKNLAVAPIAASGLTDPVDSQQLTSRCCERLGHRPRRRLQRDLAFAARQRHWGGLGMPWIES